MKNWKLNELVEEFWGCYKESKYLAGSMKCVKNYKDYFIGAKRAAKELITRDEFKNNKYYDFVKKFAEEFKPWIDLSDIQSDIRMTSEEIEEYKK